MFQILLVNDFLDKITKKDFGTWSAIILTFEIIIVFILSVWLLFMILKHIVAKQFDNPKLDNPYLAVSLVAITFILVFGTLSMRNLYMNVYPLSIKINNNLFNGSVECNSKFGFNFFEYDDLLQCTGKLHEKDKFFQTYHLEKINIVNTFYSNRSLGEEKIIVKETSPSSNLTNNTLEISISDLDIVYFSNKFYLTFIFNNNTNDEPFDSDTYKIIIVNYEENRKRELEKYNWFILVLGGSIFAIFAGINNLKQIIEDNSRRK